MTSPCTPWITVDDLLCEFADVPEAVVDLTITGAIEWMNDLTCGAYPGSCTTEVRPVPGCGHQERCGCTARWERLDLLRWLPGPVTDLVSVTVDGQAVNAAYYAVLNQRWLTARKVDGESPLIPWPAQDMGRPLGETDTWAVTVEHGLTPPAPLAQATAELVCQLLRRYQGLECDLPDNATSITRSGVSISLAQRQAGRIGVQAIDAVLDTYGCGGPGQGRPRRLVDPTGMQAGLRRT